MYLVMSGRCFLCFFYRCHKETCRLCPRQQIGTVTIRRREVGILGILHGLKIRELFLNSGPVSVEEINFPTTDGRCEQDTHSYSSMYRCAQCVSTHTLHSLITFHHANMRGSSRRFCVPKTFCHPRVMSRSLPHLTLTTSTSSLSPTSPILQPSPPTHGKRLLPHDPYMSCDDSRRSDGSTEILSPTGYEPKVIEPEDLEPERIELNKNLGPDLDQTRDRIMGDDCQSPITEDMDEFGKIGVKSLSYNQSLMHSGYDLLTRTSKTDTYVRCWLRR